jgi:hypothetical protein
MRLRAEVERLAVLLANAEAAAEEASHLRDLLEAEKESRALQVIKEPSDPCAALCGCWSDGDCLGF